MAGRTVAVIGAGVSGSLCAHQLASHGLRVTVFDKGRGPGGRMATRRVPPYAFDHGAQYFTVREPRFQRLVDDWVTSGIVAKWSGTVVTIREGVITPVTERKRYVGVPGMSAIARDLLRSCDVRFQAAVQGVQRKNERWHVNVGDKVDPGSFDVLVITTPPAQVWALAEGTTTLIEDARDAVMVPCWATVLTFSSRVDVPFDGAFVESSPLSWMARDSSKPGRESNHDTWVLHASGDWSEAHLEHSRDFVSDALLSAFKTAIGPIEMVAQTLLTHRWRYARPAREGRPDALYDAAARIGFCGDWLADGRVEAAALSGMALAERVIGAESTQPDR